MLKDLPFYTEAREADAQARQDRLNQREERRQEGTLRRAPGEKRPTALPTAHPSAEKKKKVPTKGIVLRSPVPSLSFASSSESSPPRRVPGQFGSGPSVSASKRMMMAAEEKASVDQPGSPRAFPDDAAPAGLDRSTTPNGDFPCPELEPAATFDAMGGNLVISDSPPREPNSLAIVLAKVPAAGTSTAPRALTVGFGERHQRRLCEAIELSGSTAPCECPEVVEPPAKNEDSSGPIFLSDNESPGRDPREEGGALVSLVEEPAKEVSAHEDSADTTEDIFDCPPNCAKMEEMLKHIRRSVDADLPHSQLFDSAETVLTSLLCLLELG